MSKSDFPYIHGFDQVEQDRLRSQAKFTEYTVYKDINLSEVKNLIEVGCGVGAQTEILLRRFPDLNVTGVDLSEKQLSTAREFLKQCTYAKGRYSFEQSDATSLKFESRKFDGAFLCWVLEHTPEPAKVLSEIRRVCLPGSVVYITEVQNSNFFLDPYSPNVWKFWMAYNDYQYDMKGDPFIGVKLGNLLLQQGFRDIRVETKTWHLDNRRPSKRKEFINHWTELILSGADQLIADKYIDEETVKKAKEELENVSKDPNAVFYDSFIQAKAKVY